MSQEFVRKVKTAVCIYTVVQKNSTDIDQYLLKLFANIAGISF